MHLLLLDHTAKHDLASIEMYIEQTLQSHLHLVCSNCREVITELACPLLLACIIPFKSTNSKQQLKIHPRNSLRP